MRITREDASVMELGGVPQGRGLLFAAFVSAALAVVFGMFTFYIYMVHNSWTSAIMPGIGTLFGLVLFCFVFAMSLRRETLTLDKMARTATHATWSLVAGSRKEVIYPFDTIQATAIDRSMQGSGGGKGFPTRVTRARLLITRPRRVILLDETQGGGKRTVDDVEALARQVAEFLGVGVREMGRHED